MFMGDPEQSTAKIVLSMLNDICDGFVLTNVAASLKG